MKCTWKCLTGSRSVYIDLYIYLYIYISVSLYQMRNELVCRKLHQVVLSRRVTAQSFYILDITNVRRTCKSGASIPDPQYVVM
jgi:hypothetical protein